MSDFVMKTAKIYETFRKDLKDVMAAYVVTAFAITRKNDSILVFSNPISPKSESIEFDGGGVKEIHHSYTSKEKKQNVYESSLSRFVNSLIYGVDTITYTAARRTVNQIEKELGQEIDKDTVIEVYRKIKIKGKIKIKDGFSEEELDDLVALIDSWKTK